MGSLLSLAVVIESVSGSFNANKTIDILNLRTTLI